MPNDKMSCCSGRKNTDAENAAEFFGKYMTSLVIGVLLSITALGLAAALISEDPHNASMIWHLILVQTMAPPYTSRPIVCTEY